MRVAIGSANDVVWTPCYVALGSNLNQPVIQVRRACELANDIADTRLLLSSSLYESSPMGPIKQPQFINAVIALLTQLTPTQLLDELQAIERRMGRVASVHWGPRVIDLDLLMHGDNRCDLPSLRLPHPGLLQRNFVMIPLAEIAPTLLVARSQTAAQLARELGSAGLRRVSDVAKQ